MDSWSNEQMTISHTVAIVAALTCFSSGVQAQAQASGQTAIWPANADAEGKALATAEVMKVYLKEKRVLLKHGPIPNLGMSAMTMVFSVKNPKILNSLRPGNKIKFTAEQVQQDFVVTFIEVTN